MNSACYCGNNLCIQDHLPVLYSHSYSPTVLCHFFKFALSASYLFSLFLLPFLSLLLISFSCPSLLSLFFTFSLPGHGPWLLHFFDMQFPEVKVQVQKIAHRANTQLWRCEYHGGKWHDSIALCSFGEQKKWLNLSKEV